MVISFFKKTSDLKIVLAICACILITYQNFAVAAEKSPVRVVMPEPELELQLTSAEHVSVPPQTARPISGDLKILPTAGITVPDKLKEI